MEHVKAFDNGGNPVDVVWIDGKEYMTDHKGFSYVFNVESLARWLRKEYGPWYAAGKSQQEHLSLIALGVMVGIV